MVQLAILCMKRMINEMKSCSLPCLKRMKSIHKLHMISWVHVTNENRQSQRSTNKMTIQIKSNLMFNPHGINSRKIKAIKI